MIDSDKDNMVMNRDGQKHRAELEDLLTRNARTTAVTGGGDFAEIIQRRLFSSRGPRSKPPTRPLKGSSTGMSGAWKTKVFKKLGDYRETQFRRRVQRCYPFHPDLIALAEDEWAQHAGFQRVRSIIRVFASAAHEQSRRAAAGDWAPELIDSGDLPLQSNLLKDALLNSGLVADDKTQANLREVASVDIVDQHNPERGAARRLDTIAGRRLVTGTTRGQPNAWPPRLFVRSLCPACQRSTRSHRNGTARGLIRSQEEATALATPEAVAAQTARNRRWSRLRRSTARPRPLGETLGVRDSQDPGDADPRREEDRQQRRPR